MIHLRGLDAMSDDLQQVWVDAILLVSLGRRVNKPFCWVYPRAFLSVAFVGHWPFFFCFGWDVSVSFVEYSQNVSLLP